MAGSRSRWWARRDAGRLLARAEAAAGQSVTAAELAYLACDAQRLLDAPLPLAERDRCRVLLLRDGLLAALAEIERGEEIARSMGAGDALPAGEDGKL